jgi:demethylmenaquinone methyltransferase / 2-methoxy-6-polyprenyl-1,4-benzoquinol methylase
MEKQLPHDSVVPFKDSGLSKKEQVAQMFNDIAGRYDLLNRLLSGGIDIYWRKRALRELKDIKPRTILDVATGTADLAIMAEKSMHPDKITGIDISEGMLELGRKKIAAAGFSNIELQKGDSEKINFPDNSFDAITVSFGVRNFENLGNGLTEMYRVLKPGGKLVVLEFSKPKASAFKGIYKLYMNVVAPGVGKMISKNQAAYQYLNDSVQVFPEGQDFIKILETNGFSKTSLKALSWGICTIYCGIKAEN